MSKIRVAVGSVTLLVLALVGCSKGVFWATDDGTPHVEHFTDEAPLDGTTQLISPAALRYSPVPAGDPILMLPRGASVTKVARHGTAVRVSYTSAKSGATPLVGWIPQEALPGLGRPSP